MSKEKLEAQESELGQKHDLGIRQQKGLGYCKGKWDETYEMFYKLKLKLPCNSKWIALYSGRSNSTLQNILPPTKKD